MQLDRALTGQRLKSLHQRAMLTPEVVLGSDAKIDNCAGDPTRIVVGSHSCIRGRLLVYGHGGQIRIGDWCYVGVRTEIWSMAAITIGHRVLIAHDVNIHDGSGHSLNSMERHAHFRHLMEKGHPRDPADVPGLTFAPIIIEDDAWISFGVTILKGVRIGKGSVVAAGSLVTHDIPPGMLYRCDIHPVMTPLPASRA